MKMPTIYYAHCMALYNTPQETRDVSTLTRLGFDVVNPNNAAANSVCHRWRALHAAFRTSIAAYEAFTPTASEYEVMVDSMRRFIDAGTVIMEQVFIPMVRASAALAFRSLPDGRIPAGVAQEIETAQSRGLLVFELPSFGYDRKMTLDETRTYLRKVGQR